LLCGPKPSQQQRIPGPQMPPLEVDCCVVVHALYQAKQKPGNQVTPDTSVWRLVVVWWYMHRDPNPGHQPKPGKLKGGQLHPLSHSFHQTTHSTQRPQNQGNKKRSCSLKPRQLGYKKAQYLETQALGRCCTQEPRLLGYACA
jgi:hypothetical protein